VKFAGLFLALALSLSAACSGDDDGGASVDVTPVGTKEATPTPGPIASGAGAPEPVDPQLDEELTEVARGELEATIDPGGSYEINPETLAEDAGVTDACDNFQFDFSWQISDPYPSDGGSLSWQFDNSSQQFEVASGSAGNQSVGCGLLRAENRGERAIFVAIKYAIGVRH
jgi:hypothetical protein